MPQDWSEADVKCPFFRRIRREQREIVCEPFARTATVSALRFGSPAAMFCYLREHCDELDGCRRCLRYQALWSILADE